MFRRLLPRVLFGAALAAAALLIVLVIAAPLADNGGEPAGWGRVVALFARDAALRRTAVATAVGLAVTACVFFRPGAPPRPAPPRRRRKTPQPPPPSVAGA
jgi:hypothetical protein